MATGVKTPEEIVSEHEDMIYPVVRVRYEKIGGSGFVVYSSPTPATAEAVRKKYETYVITCWHVIEPAIKFVKKRHAFANRDIVIEDRALVQVEIFEYEELSRLTGGTTYNAEIMAWDKEHDLALLRLQTSKPYLYVAKLYPKNKEDDIKLGASTVAVGCSLGHEPIINYGHLAAKHDMIENKEYWMSTANTIFGNSGGAEFLRRTHEFIGVTARISGIQLGFSVDIVTWMGFFVPVTSVYWFLDDRIFQFIYDPNFTSDQCEKLRDAKKAVEERKMLVPKEFGGTTENID